jgi:hypothetical protein
MTAFNTGKKYAVVIYTKKSLFCDGIVVDTIVNFSSFKKYKDWSIGLIQYYLILKGKSANYLVGIMH